MTLEELEEGFQQETVEIAEIQQILAETAQQHQQLA
jgi:hypothetical protein